MVWYFGVLAGISLTEQLSNNSGSGKRYATVSFVVCVAAITILECMGV